MRFEIVALSLLVIASGCIQTGTTKKAETIEYTPEQAQKSALNLQDIREMSFHRNGPSDEEYVKTHSQKKSEISHGNFNTSKYPLITKTFLLKKKESFILGLNSTRPLMIISAVHHYSSSGDAKQTMNKIAKNNRDSEAIENFTSKETYYGRKIKAELTKGSKLTTVYSRQANVILQVHTANFKEFKERKAEKLLLEMKNKLRSN